jgi:hypothetical protein
VDDKLIGMKSASFFRMSPLFRSEADTPSRRQASAAADPEGGKILPLRGDDRLTRLTEHVVHH